MINYISALIFALAALAAPAFAQTSTATYYVVAGSDTFVNAPDLPATGGTADCEWVRDHLLNTLHYPANQVLAMCGPELVRAALFLRLQEFLTQGISSESTVVVAWFGTGGTDPVTRAKVFAFADSSFDVYPMGTGYSQTTGFTADGLTAALLYGVTKRILPTTTTLVVVSDVAQGGTYPSGGKEIELVGPSADDFIFMDGVYAVSPRPNIPTPQGAFAHMFTACVQTNMSGGDFARCMGNAAYREGMLLDLAGKWNAPQLVVLPEQAAKEPRFSKEQQAQATLFAGGGGALVASGVGIAHTYKNALGLLAEIESGAYGSEGAQLEQALANYEAYGNRLAAYYALAAVGAASIGEGFLLPNQRAKTARISVNATPLGVSVAGNF